MGVRWMLLAAASVAASVNGEQVLCSTPTDCARASAVGLCGNGNGEPLQRKDAATICVGFQEVDGEAAAGSKALFQVEVDTFASLRIDTRTCCA